MRKVRFSRERSRGFSLVEIMVAVVIGMVGVLIMMQLLATTEGQKRTTTSGNDAMNEGLLALYALQSDIQSAGTGLTDPLLYGCNLTLRPGLVTPSLAAVVINPANSATFPFPVGDANSDSIFVFSSRSTGSPQGDKVTGAGNRVQNPPTYKVGDVVIVAPAARANPCNLTLDSVAVINVGTSSLGLTSGAVVAVGDFIFNLGQSYRAVGYAIRGGNLTMCDYSNAATNCNAVASWTAINNNIVNLRMQYGRDITPAVAPVVPAPGAQPVGMDGVVDIYDQAAPANYCELVRISTVRLALTSRSAVMEKDVVTGVAGVAPAPSWEGSAANYPNGSTAAPITLTGDPNWQFYRYRVFQSTLPMRNINWLGKVSTC